jgi:hypothetical protein
VQLVVITLGQCLNIRQTVQKPGIVALHRLHTGLLEHDLRHPDAIGLPIRPPGQLPPVLPIPGHQHPRQYLQLHKTTSFFCPVYHADHPRSTDKKFLRILKNNA